MAVTIKVTKDLIKCAAKGYCDRNPGNEISEDEHGKIRILEGGVAKDDDVILWEEGGKLKTNNTDFGMIFMEYIRDEQVRDLQEKSSQSPSQSLVTTEERQKIAEIKAEKSTGNAIKDWRDKQDRTYAVEGGKQVPNAFAASEAANLQGINVETDSGRTEFIAWGKARAIDIKTGQYREAKVNFEWSLFRQRTAWEIARGMEKRVPGIIAGADEKSFLPIVDGAKSFKGQPAPLYLHMQVLNRWTFADRDAESKAERRAILKLLNREWRDKDELEMEHDEERAVQEMKA